MPSLAQGKDLRISHVISMHITFPLHTAAVELLNGTNHCPELSMPKCETGIHNPLIAFFLSTYQAGVPDLIMVTVITFADCWLELCMYCTPCIVQSSAFSDFSPLISIELWSALWSGPAGKLKTFYSQCSAGGHITNVCTVPVSMLAGHTVLSTWAKPEELFKV